jgi:hypothetical protein
MFQADTVTGGIPAGGVVRVISVAQAAQPLNKAP